MVDSDQVEIFLSSSSGFVPAPPLTSGMGTSDATIADFDADGHPDLAIANAVDDTLTIFLGDGTGAFTATPASPLAVAARDMVTGDFDGDGKLDLATMLRTGQAGVKLLLGDGAGAFTDGGTTAIGTAYNALAATDFDSDGDLDLVTSGGGINGTVVTLRNDGAGTLSVVNAMPRPTGPCRSPRPTSTPTAIRTSRSRRPSAAARSWSCTVTGPARSATRPSGASAPRRSR